MFEHAYEIKSGKYGLSEKKDETSKPDTKDEKDLENTEKKPENQIDEEDEFNVSLAAMEEEIKPKILNILNSLNK